MSNFIYIRSSGGAPVSSVLTDESAVFGDMTARGGLSAARDGTTSQTSTACASRSGQHNGYVGCDWGSGVSRIITEMSAYGSSNWGFSEAGNEDYQIHCYGSNSSPSNGTDGTLLGSSSVFTDINGTNTITLEEDDLTTATGYRYHWVYVDGQTDTGQHTHLAEITFTGYDA